MTVPVPDQLEFIVNADGVTKDFSYPKRFLQRDEIVVSLRGTDGVDVQQVLNTNYTISGSSWSNGGTVSFFVAPKAPNKVVLYRLTQAKQTVDLENNQRNDAPSVETQLDRLTMAIQDRGRIAEMAITGLNAEVISRKEGDAALDDRVNQEVQNREEAIKALASLIGQSGDVEVPYYDSQTAITLANIKPTINSVQAGGYYSAGDGGAAILHRVADADGAIQSNDGAYWRVGEAEPSVLMYGLKSDGTFNNDDAWSFMVAATSEDQTIAIPAGEYFFATHYDFTSRKLKADSGAVFAGPQIYAGIYLKNVVGILNFRNTDLQFGFDIKSNPRNQNKAVFAVEELDHSDTGAMNMTNSLFRKVWWADGDDWSFSGTGMSAASDIVTLNGNTLENGYAHAAVLPAKWGSQYTFAFSTDGTVGVIPLGVVRTLNSYIAIFAARDEVGYNIRIKNAGAAPVDFRGPLLADDGVEDHYKLSNSHLTIDVIDAYTFKFGLNGVAFYTGRTTTPIEYVGAGCLPIPGANLFVYNVTRIDRPVSLAPFPKRMLYIGDSLTDERNVGYPYDLEGILQDSGGIQVEFSLNVAVSGDTVAMQRARLEAVGDLWPFTDAVFAIGTNDIQAATASATFEAGFRAILTRLRSYNVPVTVLVPPPFYSRAIAVNNGGLGLDTSNFAGGTFYRSRIQMLVSEAQGSGSQIRLIDLGKVLGATIGRYLSLGDLGPRWATELDTNVYDNLHTTRRARTKIAKAVANAVAALTFGRRSSALKETLALNSWFNTSAGWSNGGTVYGATEDGRKFIRIHSVASSGATVTDGTTILTLPAFLIPKNYDVNVSGSMGNGTPIFAVISKADGTVQIHGATANSFTVIYAEYE